MLNAVAKIYGRHKAVKTVSAGVSSVDGAVLFPPYVRRCIRSGEIC